MWEWGTEGIGSYNEKIDLVKMSLVLGDASLLFLESVGKWWCIEVHYINTVLCKSLGVIILGSWCCGWGYIKKISYYRCLGAFSLVYANKFWCASCVCVWMY